VDSIGTGIVILIAVVVAIVIYFLPTIIASNRKKQNFGAIFALNLLLGWCLIGWVVSLVWALTHDPVPAIR
jgi:hypothetical protein